MILRVTRHETNPEVPHDCHGYYGVCTPRMTHLLSMQRSCNTLAKIALKLSLIDDKAPNRSGKWKARA